MSVESKDELRKLRDEKIERKYQRLLSALHEKERNLEKTIENLEDKLAARRFEEKIQAEQRVIAQLFVKKDKLERKLKKLDDKSMLMWEEINQGEGANALPIVVQSPKLDLEAVRKEAKEPEKKSFWKLFS